MEKSMKTMEKSIKTMEHSMKTHGKVDSDLGKIDGPCKWEIQLQNSANYMFLLQNVANRCK